MSSGSSKTEARDARKPAEDPCVFLGLVITEDQVQLVNRIRRSYRLQVAVMLLLTASLPFLVGHLHPEEEQRPSGALLQPAWDWILQSVPGISHFLFGSVCACVTFVASCLYFSYKDLARHDSKIQKDWWPTLNDMLVVGVPQIIIYILANGISWVIWDIRIDLPKEAPTLWEFGRDLAIMLIVGDYYIYFEHRTMHQFVYLRDNIHSVHHSYKKVFSWAGGWVHPLEDLAAVLTQVACPVFFLRPHPLCFWFFVSLWTLLLVDEHSGHDVWWSPYYYLPFAAGGGGAPHDIHHYKPHTNFGFVFNIWDILFNTMQYVTEWYPGKTDFEPYVGGKDFRPVKGFVPTEGWTAYNQKQKKTD